ncbi:MAG: 3-dehydroquinate synthase [Gammaproteobacteria bacterium]|nr:3-dehydroquinate synthase [Gammaproteobacteria bacterium]MDH4314404.1 3-dehydroquinate synthase [Gammaproteobacteria bacterium]MDH5213188.1 3-dehydroquinate synthase [Gammaproteobacteria bacterium]MDH5499688.1 3-dehydroquinate synthase [Gammaproteobacteria bacterium]
MHKPRELTVALGDRSYPIIIGNKLLNGGFELSKYVVGPDCLVVSNDTVAPIYLDALLRLLVGRNARSVVLQDGERYKTLASVAEVIDGLVAAGASRDVTVIALGGGVVGDIAGFAAACYMRGVPFIQIPTTLLAQVDSSVGGKTGVNHEGGKNLIGAFHQPQLVLIDTDTLMTLPAREFSAGLAEVIKHAAIFDAGFFAWLESNIGALLRRDSDLLAEAICRSCEIKAAVVAEDEKEHGRRALLNFGHTFGHAIENCLGYGEWLHGEAVAAGMIMAAELSGLASEDRDRIRKLIAASGLPVEPPPIGAKRLGAAMQLDKKVQQKKLRFVLLKSLGEAFVTSDYDESKLQAVLKRAGG